MKKVMLVFLLVVFFAGLASAKALMFEVKGGYFNPSGTELRSDYGTFFDVGGEVTFGILPRLKLWAGVDYLSAKGQPPNAVGARIHLTPIQGGIKYILSVGVIRFYGGAGVSYINYKKTAPAGDVTDSALGFVFKVGALFKVKGPFVVDLFFENSYGSVNPAGVGINVGGITAGIGIGFESII